MLFWDMSSPHIFLGVGEMSLLSMLILTKLFFRLILVVFF